MHPVADRKVWVVKTLLGREYFDIDGAVDTGDIEAGYTALMYACLNGRVQCARSLVDAYAELDKRDKNGRTALMHACQSGHVECAEILVKAGANVRLRDKNGQDAIQISRDLGIHNNHRAIESVLQKKPVAPYVSPTKQFRDMEEKRRLQ